MLPLIPSRNSSRIFLEFCSSSKIYLLDKAETSSFRKQKYTGSLMKVRNGKITAHYLEVMAFTIIEAHVN